MAEITMDSILIKLAESVLKYLGSIANNKAASSIEYYWKQKEISELDEAIHVELESMASDLVAANAVEDYLSKNGFFPGSQMNYDWSLVANITNRMVEDFFLTIQNGPTIETISFP